MNENNCEALLRQFLTELWVELRSETLPLWALLAEGTSFAESSHLDLMTLAVALFPNPSEGVI
jgi:hypothetical protein